MKCSCRELIANLDFADSDVTPNNFYLFKYFRNQVGYIIYRLLWMLCVLACLTTDIIWNRARGTLRQFLFYLTSWCEVMVVIYVILAFAVAVYGLVETRESRLSSGIKHEGIHLVSAQDENRNNPKANCPKVEIQQKSTLPHLSPRSKLKWFHKSLWFMYEVSFISSITVTTIFWCFIYGGHRDINFLDFYRHGLNCVILMADTLLSRYPAHFMHALYSCFLGVFYVFFTFILHKIGKIVDASHITIPQKVYWFLDWDSNSLAPLYLCIAMIPVTFILQCLLLFLHSVRSKLFFMCRNQ